MKSLKKLRLPQQQARTINGKVEITDGLRKVDRLLEKLGPANVLLKFSCGHQGRG